MCGFAGFIGNGNLKDLEEMAAVLSHRGPDAEGYWYDNHKRIYLAHKRLSIIDIPDGAQPMWTADNMLGVVYNGEIYNHRELRHELEKRGHRFLSDHSDTEVLLLGYREWRQDMPERLNGMWAFAIYDAKKGQIFLSRDGFGQKPLYYSCQNGTFGFASELKSLIQHSNIAANLSISGLKKYFGYGFIPTPGSLFEGIYKLPGGSNLTLDASSLKFSIFKFWDFILEPFEPIPKNAEAEWSAQLRELMSKAVKRHLMSDVPLGIFLSGGVDSSSIAAYAAELAGKDRIQTFCIGFSESSFDETEYSRRASAFIGTHHHSKTLSIESAKSLLPEIIEKLDEPMGDSSLLPTYLLSRETRRHVTVALGGDGADELFAGYDPFRALKLAEFYQSVIPKPVHMALKMLAARLPVSFRNMSLDFKIKRALKGLSYFNKIWNPVWLGPLDPSELEELFEEPVDLEDLYAEAISCWDNCPQSNIVDKTLQFYTKLYLQDDILAKTDRAGMLNSLEVRAPFLDKNLVEFVRKIPSQYKYRKGETKYILKKALETVLPKQIIYRHKHGFGIPVGKWFYNGSLPANIDDAGFQINPKFFLEKWNEHRNQKRDHRLFLWNYWLLEHYLMNPKGDSQNSEGFTIERKA
jgi:asparagine synthase (glutamine-hydrolysing)